MTSVTESHIGSKAIVSFLTAEVADLDLRIAETRKDTSSRSVAEASRLLLIRNHIDMLARHVKHTMPVQTCKKRNTTSVEQPVEVDTHVDSASSSVWFDMRLKLPVHMRVFKAQHPTTGDVFFAMRKYGGGIYKLRADFIGNASASASDFNERIAGFYKWQYV